MKVDELLAMCDRADEAIAAKGKFSVVIPGYRNGDRCRVAPGLMGDFLSHVGGEGGKPEGTLVLLDSAKVRAWIKKNAEAIA